MKNKTTESNRTSIDSIKRLYALVDVSPVNSDQDPSEHELADLRGALASRLTIDEFVLVAKHFNLEPGPHKTAFQVIEELGISAEESGKMMGRIYKKLSSGNVLPAFPIREAQLQADFFDPAKVKKKDKIGRLGLSMRTYNVLRRGNIDTIQELLDLDSPYMIRNLGKKSAKELVDVLTDYGFGDYCLSWQI